MFMKIYTRKGDDGTTGLYYGGRVRKDDVAPIAYGDVDEAQSAIGVARAHGKESAELNGVLLHIERDLWILMADLATAESNRHKLVPGATAVTQEMVDRLEELIDEYAARYELPPEFIVPGEHVVASFLDLARAVVRRAERTSIVAAADGSHVVKYLNRLSDLLFTLARWQEGHSTTAKEVD